MTLTTITDADLPLQRAYRWERERGQAIFLTQPMGGGEVRDWTWSQAMDEARRMAAWLSAQGFEPGTRIAIMSKNTAWWILADLAIWMAGHVSVPVYPNLVADSVRPILQHSGARLVFIGKLDDWRAMVGGIPDGVATVGTPLCEAPVQQRWDALVKKTAPQTTSPVFAADALATLIYTSGTTGTPKGAMHGFASFAHTARALQQVLSSTSAERALSYLPLAHVAERCLVEGQGIYLGSRIFFAESLDTFLADLQRARPTFFFSVPRLWVKFQHGVLAKMPREKLDRLVRIPILGGIVKKKILRQLGLDSVRFAGTGAAPLPPDAMAWYRGIGLELLEGYGMTEQFAFATTNMPGRSGVGTVGEPTPCCEVKLADSGEILTRGPAHMQGYFREPGLTAEAVDADGWLHTGDLGAFDAQGRLAITGRAKEQFKTSKGKYVAPAPIEGKLGAFTRIEACMVTGSGWPQPFALAMLPADAWAALQPPAARQAFGDQLQAHLAQVNEALDPHERLDFVAVVPEQWTVESGFVTPTLKLKRHNIEKHYEQQFAAWARQRQPVVWAEATAA